MHPNSIRALAIVSYLLLPGWFFAFLINNSRPTKFATFHVRQSFGIMGLSTLVVMIIGLINFLTSSPILSLILIAVGILPMIVLWFLGILSALQGKIKPIPVVGISFQKWFAGL